MPKRTDRVPKSNAGETPVSVVHATTSGIVHLLVTYSKDGGWNARMWGADLTILRRFSALNDANRFLMKNFARHYPKHQCTPQCAALYTQIAGTDRVVRIDEFNSRKF
jgi:hypothetical protein